MNLFEQIKELEEALLIPATRKSKLQLETLLADDFIEHGSSGLIYNKQVVINYLQA